MTRAIGQAGLSAHAVSSGGVPMRVYSRALNSGSWASVEDYLPAGNALGYNQNWRYAHSGGALLMMGLFGEPWGYYPTDANGLAVQMEPSSLCVCQVVPTQVSVCAPLGYGGCEGGQCGEGIPPVLRPFPFVAKG